MYEYMEGVDFRGLVSYTGLPWIWISSDISMDIMLAHLLT